MRPLAVIPLYLRTGIDRDVFETCVRTFRKTAGRACDLLVVDDHSPANELVRECREITLRHAGEMVVLPEHGGFSRAVNVGLRRALAEERDAILVNSDIEFGPTRDWLPRMQLEQRVDGDGLASVVGALLTYPNGLIQHAGIHYSSAGRNFGHRLNARPLAVAVGERPRSSPVTAALQFIRHECLVAVGLYDESFRLGWEDVDYAVRTVQSGRGCVFDPDIRAIHHEQLTRRRDGRMSLHGEWSELSWNRLNEKYDEATFERLFPAAPVRRSFGRRIADLEELTSSRRTLTSGESTNGLRRVVSAATLLQTLSRLTPVELRTHSPGRLLLALEGRTERRWIASSARWKSPRAQSVASRIMTSFRDGRAPLIGRARRGARTLINRAALRWAEKLLSDRGYAVVPREGFDVVRRDYFSPVPDLSRLPEDIWTRRSSLGGIEFDTDSGIEFIEHRLGRFVAELADIPREDPGVPGEFFLHNDNFEAGDAELLYAMVRALRPKTVIELGSGFTTLLIDRAARRNAEEGTQTLYRAYDPYPREHILGPVYQSDRLESISASDVPLEIFEALEPGDILFVDSTHTVKLGSDVNFLILDVLPLLRAGVWIHLHDIFLPFEYPRLWFEKMRYLWAEQYLLQAFLAFNREFEVILPAQAIARDHPDRLHRAVPSFIDGVSPASFWLRRQIEARPPDRGSPETG